jgi:hypothetical protein
VGGDHRRHIDPRIKQQQSKALLAVDDGSLSAIRPTT